MKIITFANNKGGCAKTTTSLNLAVTLAKQGARVLAVDLDFQGNLSTALGADLSELSHNRRTAHRLMLDTQGDVEEYLHKKIRSRLDLLPACLDDDAEDLIEARQITRELQLRQKLLPITRRYDYCIVDTPPSLRAATLNGLAVADLTIVPIDPTIFALTGLAQLMRKVALIRDAHKPTMQLMAVMTRYTQRQILDKQIRANVVDIFTEDFVFNTTIPSSTHIGEATTNNSGIAETMPESPAGFAFRKLAKEVLEVLGDEQQQTNKESQQQFS